MDACTNNNSKNNNNISGNMWLIMLMMVVGGSATLSPTTDTSLSWAQTGYQVKEIWESGERVFGLQQMNEVSKASSQQHSFSLTDHNNDYHDRRRRHHPHHHHHRGWWDGVTAYHMSHKAYCCYAPTNQTNQAIHSFHKTHLNFCSPGCGNKHLSPNWLAASLWTSQLF